MPDVVQLLHSSLGDVRVGIDKTGRGRKALQVDDAYPGSLASKAKNFRISPDFNYHAASNRDRLRHRVLGINGENVAVN